MPFTYANRVATQPGRPGEPGKVGEFQHFIENSEKVREFENFKAWRDFHANFKIKLLRILSYIDTLNGLFSLFLSLKVKF